MGLDIVELVMAVEDAFQIDIPDVDAKHLRTVGDLYWYVREHAPGPTPAAPLPEVGGAPAGELWERLLDVIERDTGVARERLVPSARFVEDLGLD